MELHEALDLAKHMEKLARKEILRYFNSNIVVEHKADSTPVTIADKKAEEVIRHLAEKETPKWGILGEEFGEKPGSSEYQWVIDPIDGTKAFIRGVPLFGCLIALIKSGEPVLGLMGLPAMGCRIWATKGSGCFNDEGPCQVSGVTDIRQATILDGSATTMENMGYGSVWRTLRGKALLHRGWGDCYGYYMVATGKAEVMADPIVEYWDIAAPSIIVQEAGGQFSSLKGEAGIFSRSGLATNGCLHKSIVQAFCSSEPQI